ncbi:MAG: response regulator transcription factor [Caldilineaceae bacterium]|nr:response regulator transcription factor [Caldilineaceae bacterium]
MIRILLVDDHDLVREGLVQIIKTTTDVVVAGEAADGQTAMSLLRKQPFDVVVLDIALPDQTGLHWLKVIKDEQPTLPVLILTMYGERQYAVRCMRAGAAGYLTKNHAGSELLTAIRRVACGQKYITATVGAELATALEHHASTASALDILSDRELEVLMLLTDGHSMSDIAEHLMLSIKTVSTYRARLLQKLRMSSNAELIRYAIQEGITSQLSGKVL